MPTETVVACRMRGCGRGLDLLVGADHAGGT
jgi:hypothetical protein